MVDSGQNLYVARSEQNPTEVCRSTANNSGVTDLECRDEWNDIIEGRVEICLENSYSSICDDRWDSLEAAVVCRQLNYLENGNPLHGTISFIQD